MEEKLITKAEFARIAGCSKANVTKVCKGELSAALNGNLLDFNHDLVQLYLKKRQDKGSTYGKKNTAKSDLDKRKHPQHVAGRAAAKQQRLNQPLDIEFTHSQVNDSGLPSPQYDSEEVLLPPRTELTKDILPNIEAVAHLSLKELLERYGTQPAFSEWLKSYKQITDINTAKIKNAQVKQELVSRELISRSIISPINTAHIQLMRDGAKSIARRVYSEIKAGSSVEECEKTTEKLICSYVKSIKEKLTKALKNHEN